MHCNGMVSLDRFGDGYQRSFLDLLCRKIIGKRKITNRNSNIGTCKYGTEPIVKNNVCTVPASLISE